MPVADERHAVDGYSAAPVGQVIGVVALEPVPGRPIVAANAFALTAAVDALEAIGRPCSNHCTTPRPSFRPAGQAPVHVEVSSGAGCQSHIRHPDCGSSNQRPSSHGAVQLIPSESGSMTSHGLADSAVAAVSANTNTPHATAAPVANRSPRSMAMMTTVLTSGLYASSDEHDTKRLRDMPVSTNAT